MNKPPERDISDGFAKIGIVSLHWRLLWKADLTPLMKSLVRQASMRSFEALLISYQGFARIPGGIFPQ